MPREAQELVRQGGFKNAEKFFILSFEGTVTEKRYFESLRASSLFNDCGLIETIPLSRKKTAALGSNPNVVKSLLKAAKDDFNFRSTDEFWLIIDRDQWESIHHIDLSKLVEDCKNEDNFFIAMSNPCFEIWLIFHHTDLTRYSEDELDKIKENVKISRLYQFDGLKRVEVETASVGDIICVSGITGLNIGETICSPDCIEPLPFIKID